MQNFIKTILSAMQAWTKKEIIKKTGEIKENINSIQKEVVTTNEALDSKMNTANPVATGSFSMGRQDGSDIGRGSYAVGNETIASGRYSHAEGYYTTASGEYSHAEGSCTLAATNFSHAEGVSTIADGSYSHAEGNSTIASNISSHAEGLDTAAMGAYSHSEGHGTAAAGECSHAEGKQTYINLYLTGQGGSTKYTVAGSPSLVVGALLVSEYPSAMAYITAISGKTITTNKTLSTRAFSNQRIKMFPKFASGIASHIEGQDTTASGHYSHAEGYNTKATIDGTAVPSFSNLTNSSHLGYASHAEGIGTVACGVASHAEGNGTAAVDFSSHAEGSKTKASGSDSHAEGNGTTASGNYSHAEGRQTIAQRGSQHVQGEFNIVDIQGSASARGKYAHIVGNGTSGARSNAHTLDWNGVGWFQGGLQIGGTEQDGEGVGYVPAVSSAQVGQTIVVSEVDENGKPTKWEAADISQGSGAKEMTLLAEVDCSVANGNIELTNLGGITEIYVEWWDVKNESGTDSGYTLYVNGKDCGMAVIPIWKSTTTKYGWSHAIFNGLAWMCSRSDGAGSTDYRRFGGTLQTQYYHCLDAGVAETIAFNAPLTQYQAVSGTIKIYGR